MQRTILRNLAFVIMGAPALLLAQYKEIKMGEYLHYAVAAANGGIYAGYDSIGYASPSVYTPSTDWVDLPCSTGFNTTVAYFGYTTGISHDGSIVSGYTAGVTPGGVSTQYAAYWVDGVETILPAPPDDPTAVNMSATGISGDGSTLLVEDTTSAKVETYTFNIVSGKFTALGFLGTITQQTYAKAINYNGTVVAGYSNLDNGTNHGFLWTASTGLKDLGIPTNHPNTYYLEPTCISDDGTTLFGQLTELNGWVGFRYTTAAGFQDIGGITPSACTADGTETVGIENLYFPAVWSVGNGGGYIDDLLSVNGTKQALGTLSGPATISPDGSALTASGPDVYLTDQTWYGVWQTTLPFPLKTAPIAPQLLTFSTPYGTTLYEPAGTLTQYAEFNTGASSILRLKPAHASSFTLRPDGAFNYTPKAGYGDQTDSFYYQLKNAAGTSSISQAQIFVASHLSTLEPQVLPVGSPETVITATGVGFVATDAIYANGNYLPTKFVSSTELKFRIPASALTAKHNIPITVDGTSNIVYLSVK